MFIYLFYDTSSSFECNDINSNLSVRELKVDYFGKITFNWILYTEPNYFFTITDADFMRLYL